MIGQVWLTAAGAGLIAALIVVAYRRQTPHDPGVTTELALFITYLLGVAAVEYPQFASAAFVVVAVLLASKTRLHRFATQVLTEGEMRDGLILAGAALVVAPLIPNQPLPYLANANPSHLWRLVLLLMALQAVGYIALRVTGARVGLVVVGLASGIVSSTSTMATMGAQARQQSGLASAYAAGALCSNLSSMSLLVPVALTIHPPVLKTIAPALLAGMAAGLGIAMLLVRRQAVADIGGTRSGPVFSVAQALGFAALLTVLTGIITLLADRYGTRAAEIGAALAATVDMHAVSGSLFSLAAGNRLEETVLMHSLLLALTTNMAVKAVIAFTAGGKSFGVLVTLGLLGTVGAMWLSLLF